MATIGLAATFAGVKALDDVQGDLGDCRAFHIDADEVAGFDGMGDQVGDDFLGQLGVEFEAHLGELDTDVGVKAAALDLVQQPVVDVGGVARLVGSSNVFPQAVEGRRNSLSIHRFGSAEDVVDLQAGHEARRHPASDGGRLGEAAQGGIPR